MSSPSVDTRGGFIAALCAYSLWSTFPYYFKQIAHIDALEVVLHRIIWAVPFTLLVLFVLRRMSDAGKLFSQPKNLAWMFLCACVISINWGLFTWAIANDFTIETALGYYINPLITIALGGIFLGEKFETPQLIAIGLAASAVLLLTVVGGSFPWISLTLAISFAAYGFLKKRVPVGPLQGFLVEVYVVSIIAIPALCWLIWTRQAAFLTNTHDTWFLIASGPLTAIPLILFATGAKGLKLSTLGIMQYIAPTGIFITGVFIFKEPFGAVQLIAFLLIWTALALYSWSAFFKKKPVPATS